MSDTQRMESSLQSIDRLMQRLVVLFEQERKTGRKAIMPGFAGAPVSSSGGVPPALTDFSSAEFKRWAESMRAVTEGIAETEKDLTAAAQDIKAVKTRKFKDSTTEMFKSLNEFFDGSLRIAADTRQALNLMSNVASSLTRSIASLETQATKALAASKGVQSAGQTANEIAGLVSSTARNITQFGVRAGGVISVVETAVMLLAREQKKLEHTVALRVNYEKQMRDSTLSARKLTEHGKTSAELQLETLRDEEALIAQRRVEYDAIKKARYDLLGTESNRAKELSEVIKLDEVNAESRRLLEDKLKSEIQAQKDLQAQLDAISAVTNSLTEALSKTTESANRSYDAIDKQLQDAINSQHDNLSRHAPLAIQSIDELYRKAQENRIAEMQEQFTRDLAKLKESPILDSEGNVIQQEMLAAERALIEVLLEKLRSLSSETPKLEGDAGNYTYNGQKVDLTDDEAAKIRERYADRNAALDAARSKAQTDYASLGIQGSAASLVDEQSAIAKRLRDQIQLIEIQRSLHRSGLIGDKIDPSSEVEADIRRLEQVIGAYQREIANASEGNKGPLLQELTKHQKALELLVKVNKELAKRASADLLSDLKLEDISRSFSDQLNALEVSNIQATNTLKLQSERNRKAHGPIADLEEERAARELQQQHFQALRALREKEINEREREYSDAKKKGSTEAQLSKIRRDILKLYEDDKKALQDQAKVLANYRSNNAYNLHDDRPTYQRGRITQHITGRFGVRWNRENDGLGSESARLVRDVFERQRLRSGKLTPEEKAEAKEERRLNSQLKRAQHAVAEGGGTARQRELVRSYNEAKIAGEPKSEAAKILGALAEVNRHLSNMSGLRERIQEKNE